MPLSRPSASPVKQAALLGVMPTVPSTLGQVATNCHVMESFVTSQKQTMSRSPHFARDAVSQLKLVLPGFYATNTGEKTTGANTIWTASIEYPVGTLTQVLFGGAATGTATDGSMLTSDFVTVAIPRGALFWVRLFQQNSVGVLLRQIGLAGGHMGATLNYAASGLTDATMSGTPGNSQYNLFTPGNATVSATGFCVTPCAILAQTTQQSFYLLADSRGQSYRDACVDGPDQGNLARSIGSFAAYINGGIGGDTLSQFVASHTNRLILAQLCSSPIIELGINDRGTGDTAMRGNVSTIRGYFPSSTPVYLTTMEPVSAATALAVSSLTSSGTACTATVNSTAGLQLGGSITVAGATPAAYNGTVAITGLTATTISYTAASAPGTSPATGTVTYTDGWATLNQTPDGANAARVAHNNWRRGVPAGFKACLELADPVEAGRDSGIWRTQPGGGPITADGTHAFNAGYMLQKASGAVSPATMA